MSPPDDIRLDDLMRPLAELWMRTSEAGVDYLVGHLDDTLIAIVPRSSREAGSHDCVLCIVKASSRNEGIN